MTETRKVRSQKGQRKCVTAISEGKGSRKVRDSAVLNTAQRLGKD